MKSAIRNYALLFASCVLFHIAGTWIVPLIDRDEPRFSEASREMIERGDYVIPYFNDDYRFDKPPFTYWAQVASYRLLGKNDFAARFPSVVATALTALSIFVWGKRMANERVGLWAAIIFTLSLQVVEHAKAAVADMWLVLFVTLAHWLGYELLRDRLSPANQTSNVKHPTFVWWLFNFALAFAFLAKGPIGWTPVLTVTSTIIFLREPQLFRRFAFGRGMLFAFGIVCLWGIPALIRTHGAFFSIGIGRHVLGRSVTAMGGHGARSFWFYLLLLPFYFVTIFFSLFPWSLKLPWLIKNLRRDRDKIDIYLLGGSAVIFGIFTLVTTKLLHYTLPAFPLLALLFARKWFAADMSILPLKKMAIVFGCVCLALALFVTPFVTPFFPSRELFRKSSADLKPEMKFACIGYSEPSLVWYFRGRVRNFLQTGGVDPDNAQRYMEQSGPRFLILPTDLAKTLYPGLPNDWKEFSTRGWNAVKGRRSDLTLILKPD